MPIINKPWTPPAPTPSDTIDIETLKFPHPIERYKFEPDEINELDLIYNQVQNRNWIALKAFGEQVAFYRQKETGQMCSCVDKNRQSAVSTCPVCHGVGKVGGYDYLGKTLVQFPQTPKTKIITELGIKVQEDERPWTGNYPLLRERDFVVRKLYVPLSGQIRKVDEPVIRGNYTADEDVLERINVMAIWKLSNTKQANASDYVEGTDFMLAGGEMVIEESGEAPVTDTRTLRLLGKKPSIFMQDGDGSQTVNINGGLQVGITTHVKNSKAWSGYKDATLSDGVGTDVGYYVFTISQEGIHDKTAFPLESFIATIAGDRIIWLTGNRPTTGETYYITYDYIQTFTRRYQLKDVSAVAPQGAVQLQNFDISLLDPTHPIYGVGSIFDNGDMIDFRNGLTKEMIKQLYHEFGIPSGNETDKRFNQEAGYY